MGTDHSIDDHTNNFDPYEWQQISRTNDTRILTNRHNHNNIIQQHTITISDDKQLQLAQQLYQFRINDNQLVSTKYFNLEKQQEMCSKSYAGYLYTENISIRLSNIVHVPFPDILHIYNQALNGFHRLSRRLGYFKVNQDCIGVNNQHVAKVWHSPNFSQIQPHFRAQSEQDMVHNIVSIIQSNTDSNSMPRQQPSFFKFLYQDIQRAGFGEAKRKLQLYANYFNHGVIPRYLNCVEKAGGAQSIKIKWEQTNGNFSNYVNGYSNAYQNGYNNVSYKHKDEAVIGQAVVPNIVNTTANNNNTITNTNYSLGNTNSNLVNNQSTIQRNYGPTVIENTTTRYIPSVPLDQVNSTYTYQNNSSYIPANKTQLNLVEPRLASSSSQNFNKIQTFAPRAQSKIQTTQILQPVAQRSSIFYSPPSVIMVNKPPSIINSRILASNQPKNIYTTYRNQQAYTKSVSQLPVRRVATQPSQNMQIITNAYNPFVERSRFASPVINQSTVRNVANQQNRHQVILNGNTVVNQVPTIQVANKNVILNTVPSQNQIKTQQHIQVNSQIIPTQKKVVSTSSIPVVPANTQVTISQRQTSQATIISHPNQVVVGHSTHVSNSLIPIKVASNQSINIKQNTPLISNSQNAVIMQSKEQLSRQNILSPRQNTTVQPINVVNNVTPTSQSKINMISQTQIVSGFSSQASALSPNRPLTQVQQVISTTPQNQQVQQTRTQISLISPTINNIVLPQPTNNKQIQGSQPWTRDTLDWQYQPNFQPPIQVQRIQQIHTINSPSQQKPINNIQLSPLQSPVQQKYRNLIPQYIDNNQQSKYGSAFRQYIKTEGIRQIQLNQANSVSSRYRTDQSPSYSPQRIGASQNYSTKQDFDLLDQIKSPIQSSVPVNESISTIQAKQSKFGEDKGFSYIKQESINTSTRNFYNNYQDYSSTSNIDWQNPISNDYSSARFKKDKDNYQYGDTYKTYNYQNQYKKYEYNPSNDYYFGKQTGQFIKDQKTGSIQQNKGNASNSAYSFGSNNYYYDYNTGYSNVDTYQNIITSSKQEQNNGPPSFMNKYTENQYIPNYSFETKKQYQEYNNEELNSGYRIAQTDKNFDYQIKTQDLVTGKQQYLSNKITSLAQNHFNNKQLKQSILDDDPYSVQWDPEILADLQANVHSKSEI